MNRLAQAFLVLCALVFFAIGANTFANPLAAMSPLDLAINSPRALNEIRANYGGLQIGIGLVLIWGAVSRGFRSQALLVQTLLMGGLAFGRLVHWLQDGNPGEFNNLLLGVELGVTVASLVLWAVLRRAQHEVRRVPSTRAGGSR